jgi:hypothetical protein
VNDAENVYWQPGSPIEWRDIGPFMQVQATPMELTLVVDGYALTLPRAQALELRDFLNRQFP